MWEIQLSRILLNEEFICKAIEEIVIEKQDQNNKLIYFVATIIEKAKCDLKD